MFQVRPAEIADAPQIVEILRAGFPPRLLPLTIFGCEGIEAYLRDTIGYRALATSTWYVLCCGDSGPLGVAEVRRAPDSLYFNHLFVSQSARGLGVGTSLIFHALMLARNHAQGDVETDVFLDNPKVIRGDEHMGFVRAFEQTWAEVTPAEAAATAVAEEGDSPIFATRKSGQSAEEGDSPIFAARKSGQSPGWYASELPQADRLHACYGFSEFRLHTPSGTYRIGRLGANFFRATTSDALADPCVLSALRAIGPRRSLLAIDRSDALDGRLPASGIVRARSVHLKARVDEVLERLAEFRTF